MSTDCKQKKIVSTENVKSPNSFLESTIWEINVPFHLHKVAGGDRIISMLG